MEEKTSVNSRNDSIVSLRYLIPHVPGVSMENLDKLFSSDKGVQKIIPDIRKNMKFLSVFHEAYERLKNNNISINEGLIRRIKLMDDLYQELLNEQNELRDRIENSVILDSETVEKKLDSRVDLLIKSGIDSYPYKKIAEQLKKEEGLFSLNEMFGYENGIEGIKDINAVTVITPTQTVSRFNLPVSSGIIGTGSHDYNFSRIIKAVYGKTFDLNITGQDIKIRYVNGFYNDTPWLMMTIEVPFPINSTQKKSLELLNYEIKKYEKETGRVIMVYSQINDYVTDTFDIVDTVESTTLDDVISKVIVDDNYNPKYNEYCLIGHRNDENHYNDSTFKIYHESSLRSGSK